MHVSLDVCADRIIICFFLATIRQVGKSYGKLNTNDKRKFEDLNCNNVDSGKNPSCDDVRPHP